ncbi:fumarylacetoacetate hydrolase family protein [Cochlodiniinecator piscidefendens]|uniref:fumarylacetoacetate hydrolase family protein n=1 Tax=Cochlodiniinecator piscidefendens TaxID=2715756 RepID=UPI00140D8921|nr:fumarylacetoacetate hydrolase family protein [Cochlodiniinecator piscidefendens]
MKLVTYRDSAAGEGRLGVVKDGLVIDVEYLGDAVGEVLPSSMLELIDLGPDAQASITRALAATDGARPAGIAVPQENVRLLAPIPRPRKNIFGIGLNYTEHVAESARALDTSVELPQEPVVFSKPPTTVIADGEPIQHNANMTQMLDWEVELGVIIGKRATRISKDDAMSHVFGYTVINDISARDNRRAGQWIFSKGQDSYAPMGPAIVTADDVADPHDLELWLKKNGEEKQRSNTKFMLFNIPELIADLSSGITLEPGDIIATGTPAGVGAGRVPQEWMWPGDVIECGVEGIGILRNPVVKIGD